jgi:hypothetical protein
MTDNDATLDQQVLDKSAGDFPLITSAVKEQDVTTWLKANGVDVDAVRSSFEQPTE